MNKIKLLMVSDDPRFPSGVGIQNYKLLKGLQKTGEYEIIVMACSLVQQSPNPIMFEGFKMYPVSNGYGDPATLRSVIQIEKPDITVLFSDPRFFQYAFTMDNEFRKYTKLVFYHTWDNEPFPKFNKTWYSACDQIVMLSDFSYNLMKNNGVDVMAAYHGGDPSEFYRLSDTEIAGHKQNMFKNMKMKPDFVVLYNNRNIHRKRPTDVIMSFKEFQKTHPNALLIMNTPTMDRDGNDLISVLREVDPSDASVIINESKLKTEDLNVLYNVSDVVINVAFNEGFGLSCMESLLTETPNIAVKTGGLTEQMTDGINTFGILLEPDVRTLFGIIGNPYIYQDFVSNENIVKALSTAYDLNKDSSLHKLGVLGREHIIKNYHTNTTVSKWNDILKTVMAAPSKYKQRELITI